jgi:hypothetical protein
MSRPDTADVTVHVASINTARVTELCVRTMHRTAGLPFHLVVGDGGSTDGSLEMLRTFADDGWLELEVAPGGRRHAEWLDHWYATCPTRFAVFSDSDVEYRGKGWLAAMRSRADETGAAIVATRIQARDGVEYRHPVTGAHRMLAPRPEPWLLMIDLDRTRPVVQTSFAYCEEDDPAGGLRIGFDVGAAFFRDVQRAGLRVAEMAPSFRSAYRHYGSMSWQRGADRRMPLARRGKQVLKRARVATQLARARIVSRAPAVPLG